MTIREANKKIKELDNDYEYYLREKEELLSLVIPKAGDIKGDKVDGGTREDRLSKYVELEDEKKLNDTLDYISRKKTNLIEWVERELKIIGEYEPLKAKIIKLRDKHGLSYAKISEATNYSIPQIKRIYKKYTKTRDIW